METPKPQPIAPNPPPDPGPSVSPAPPPSPAKKSHKKLIIVLIALIVGLPLLLFVIWIVASSSFVFLPGPTLGLFSLLDQKIGLTERADESQVYLASTAGSRAELVVPKEAFTEKPKISVEAAPQSTWPEDVVGGLFKIEISDSNFQRGLVFKVTLNEKPEGNFSLGYWISESKKWEWLPTVDLGNNVYQTVLTHASYVGGGAPEATGFTFQDSENQRMYQEFEVEMRKIAIDDATGEAAQYNDASWERAYQIAEELTNKVIQDYCNAKTPAALHDLFSAWQMMAFFPFPELALKIEKAYNDDCAEEETQDKYVIRQQDAYGCTFNLTLSDFFQESAQANTLIVSEGFHMDDAAKDEPAWRTGWRIYQFYTSDADLDALIHKEGRSADSYVLLDIPMHNVKSESSDLMLITFSLAGIREGESFPVWSTRVGDYKQKLSGPQQKGTMLRITPESQWRWSKTYTPDEEETIGPGIQLVGSGVLVKDNGEKGAVVSFIPSTEAMEAYLEATRKVRELAQQYNLPPELQNLYDASGKPTGLVCDEQKPLRIVLASQWKPECTDCEETSEPVNPNDQDGDGLPDLVPLPSEGDADGDGLPDLVPLPSPNDLDGDGLPDPVPLTP